MDLEEQTEASPQDRHPAEAGTPVTLQLSLPATVTLEAAYQVGASSRW